MKKSFSPQQKAAVALEAIKGELTIPQIASKYEVHPTQIGQWKATILKTLPELFSDKRKKENWDRERQIEELYKVLGHRDIELEWLKKKLSPFGLGD